MQAACLTQTTISGLDVGHSSFLITPINQPYSDHAVATAQLQLRRSDDKPLAGAPVLFHSERCALDSNQAVTDAAGHAVVKLTPQVAQGCLVDAVVLFQGTQTPVPSTAAVNFYLPADGNASVLPGQQLDLQATARRTDGSVDPTYVGTVHLTSSDANATLPPDYPFIPSDYGNKIWLAGLVLRTAGVQSVRISDVATGQPLQPDLQLQVQASQAISMQLQANPGTVAGAPYSVRVRVVDSFGGSVAGYTGTVQLSCSDPCATLPGSVTLTAADAGSKQIDGLVLRGSGQQLLQVTDTVNSALLGQALVEVVAAPGQQLRVQTLAGTVAGLALGVTVEVVDAFGNVNPAGTAQVHFSSSDAQSTLPVDASLLASDSGRKALPGLVLVTAGDQNVTVTDALGLLSPGNQVVHVDAGAATHMTLAGDTATQAGLPEDLQVQVFDAYENLARGFTGTVVFGGSDVRAQYPVAYRFGSQDGGGHLFAAAMTFVTAGDQNVTVSLLGGGITASLPHVTVVSADANRFVLSNLAVQHVACAAENPSLTVEDVYGNIVTNYAGTLTFSSAYGSVYLPGPLTLVPSDGGIKSFGLTPHLTGTGYVSISDGQVTSTQSFGVAPGALSYLQLQNLAGHVTPGSVQATAVARDVCDNVATQFTDTVHFTSTDPCALLPQDYAFTAGDGGSHDFYVGFGALGAQTLTVADLTHTAVTSASAGTNVYYPCVAYGSSMNRDLGGLAQASGVAGTFTAPAVVLDGNQNPIVAWTDTRSGEARTYLAGYAPVSQNWTGLAGSSAGLGFNTFDGGTTPPSLSLVNGVPWVAWANQAPSAAGSSVLVERYNGGWAGQGSNANDSSASPGVSGSAVALLDTVQLAVSTAGTPHVAWRNTADGSIHLRRFVTSQWVGLGGSDLVSAGPNFQDRGIALALTSSGQPVLAWQATPASTVQIYVTQWNGTSWQGLAGSNAGSGLTNSGQDAKHPALVLDQNDRPWVAWDVYVSSNWEIYALHWNGSSWVELAGSASNGGISNNASGSGYPTLALASNNLPVVAWEDDALGNHAVYLKVYDGSTWSGVQHSEADWGISAQFDVSATKPQMVLDSSDRPVVAFTADNSAMLCRWVNASGQ